MIFLLLTGGLAVLTIGADLLIRGASNLARTLGLSSLVIGLTVVAFGTSSPELFVSVKASLSNQADIAVGNVIGSNIFNLLFILGISSLIVPLTTSKQLIRLDVPVMIVTSGLVWLFSLDGSIDRVEGLGLLAGIIIYAPLLIYFGKRNSNQLPKVNDKTDPIAQKGVGVYRDLLLVFLGLVMLVLGARWLVEGATGLARMLGVSELMIGLTVVAVGTSIPEAATSIVASFKRERDLAIGNVVGSNIFNVLIVLSASAILATDGISVSRTTLQFDIPVMVAVAFACLPIFFTGGRISRWEGAMFLGYYAAYLTFLILTMTRHYTLPAFSRAMLWFVIPMTILGIAVSLLCWLKKRRSETKQRPVIS